MTLEIDNRPLKPAPRRSQSITALEFKMRLELDLSSSAHPQFCGKKKIRQVDYLSPHEAMSFVSDPSWPFASFFRTFLNRG